MRSWFILLFSTLLFTCNTTPENITIDGILEVPENRDNPNSRTLKLVYKVLKAKDTSSGKAPVVFLMGGPGGATLVMEEFWENHSLRNERDIVLMDQRGTGKSEANCVESSKAVFDIMRRDLDIKEDLEATVALLTECKEAITKRKVDLAGYNSKENAADFEDLRKALGYEKWNLFGASYGSRLGLTIMRDFPNGVRSAVLAGILAPETNQINKSIPIFETSLFAVLERCKENEDCNKRYPSLRARMLKTLKKMQTEPLHFDYDGKPFALNSHEAVLLLFVSLYNRYSIGNIPILIEALEKGNIELVRDALKGVEYFNNHINWSMHYSVMAYEELPFYNESSMTDVLNQSLVGYELAPDLGVRLLKDWHSFRASNFENQPVVSEIPTLMASGSLDHVTPVSNACEALKKLKNGYEVIFPDDAHDLFNPCFYQITEEFLNNPSQKPNTECSEERKPIDWNLSNPIQ